MTDSDGTFFDSNNEQDRDTAPTQVEDPDELNQRHRLKSINTRREEVLETLGKIGKLGLDNEEASRALHDDVTAFLTDIEWLIKRSNDTVYTTEPLGEIVVHPPDLGFMEHIQGGDWAVIGDEYPTPWSLQVHGIYSTQDTGTGYLSLQPYIRHEFSVPVQTRHEGQDTKSGIGRSVVPRQVSVNAYRLGTKFLEDVGLDARMGEIDVDPDPI